MVSTVIKSANAKTLPEIRREKAMNTFRDWLRAIPEIKSFWAEDDERQTKCPAFEFTTELLARQFDSAINRILRLKNLEQQCYKDGDTECAVNCHSRSIEVKRRFAKLLRDAVELMTDDVVLADDLVFDTDALLSELINELRMMGE